MRKIREANDAIPGEEISAKMSRMEMLVDRIFDRVEEHPESVADIRKLMEYYLPTTIKLLDAYEDLDAQPVQGENIITAKKEIEKTIDTLNTAFEKLLDDLFQDTAWDLSSDRRRPEKCRKKTLNAAKRSRSARCRYYRSERRIKGGKEDGE